MSTDADKTRRHGFEQFDRGEPYAKDVGAEVLGVARDHGFHVVAEPGHRFDITKWIGVDDREHLLVRVRLVDATPADGSDAS
jgi:hypothetical protein